MWVCVCSSAVVQRARRRQSLATSPRSTMPEVCCVWHTSSILFIVSASFFCQSYFIAFFGILDRSWAHSRRSEDRLCTANQTAACGGRVAFW